MTLRRILGGLFLALALAGCQTTSPAEHSSAAEVLFNVPHRTSDSLRTMPPIEPVEEAFTSALGAVLTGDAVAARRHAAAAGYVVVPRTQDGRDYTILLEKDNAGVGPAVAIATAPVRDAIIEAPHPVKDRDTDRQATVLFLELGARALILSGANRCAARDESPCSGRTRICGDGRSPYRTSDPAHNPATLFHLAHRYFTRRWPQSVVVQPHGFRNAGSPVWFVISDGTREKRTPDGALTGRVRDRIRASLGRRDRAVSCQDPSDRDIWSRWLCATTSVQGRDLNGSPDACRIPAEQSSGRFLHVEQVYEEVRKGYVRDWRNLSRYPGSAAILEALAQELPCIRAGCAFGR